MAKGRCFIFLGPELGEKLDAIADLRRELSKAPALEESSFYAGETAAGEIVSVLLNGSLFADSRLFLVKNAELIKKKDEVELLASYIKSPQDNTVLVLISDGNNIAKELERSLESPKNKRIFWELFEDRKTEWVASFFRREGFRITGEGIEALLELVENNTDALRRAGSHLMLFLGKDRPVTAEDVEQWLAHTREESPFTLFSRIAQGDLEGSIEVLHSILNTGEYPRAIIGGLSWCYRRLRDYTALVESGEDDEAEFRKIGLTRPGARRDYAAAFRRLEGISARDGSRLALSPVDAADRCLALIAEFDPFLLSMGSASGDTLLDLLVLKLITGADGTGSLRRELWSY
jgi:DNA polymerase-3 subunit delta